MWSLPFRMPRSIEEGTHMGSWIGGTVRNRRCGFPVGTFNTHFERSRLDMLWRIAHIIPNRGGVSVRLWWWLMGVARAWLSTFHPLETHQIGIPHGRSSQDQSNSSRAWALLIHEYWRIGNYSYMIFKGVRLRKQSFQLVWAWRGIKREQTHCRTNSLVVGWKCNQHLRLNGHIQCSADFSK